MTGSAVVAVVLQSDPGAIPGAAVVVAPVLVALVTAVLTLLVPGRARRAVSVAGVLGYAVAVALVVQRVLLDPATPRLVYRVGNWPAPVGIVAVADGLSAFMLVVAAVVAVPALVHAVFHVGDRAQALTFHPLFHFTLVGVSGAFLTGDLFNLFVWFEVMLMASYVLVVFYSGPEHTRAGLQYVMLNLVGSALMLVAIGGLYATTGTLNMADMARRLAAPETFGVAVTPVLGLSALLFGVFALKAGLVPFQFWVPGAYAAAPAPVAAMLAGVVKKVGIYAVIRLYFTVFAAADLSGTGMPFDSPMGFYGPLLVVVAAVSIVLGGVSAVSRDRFDDVLSHSSISQVGFIVLPLGVAAGALAGYDPGASGVLDRPAVLGVAAALVYSFVHGVAKTALFLASGTVERATGTDSLARLGGLARHSPALSAAVFVAGITLVGIPPVVGFFGKFLVFSAAVQGGAPLALVVAVGGAVLTIAYVTRLWGMGFWGEAGQAVDGPLPHGEVAVVVALGVALVGIGVGVDPVVSAAEQAADAALDTTAYVDGVAPRPESVDATGEPATALEPRDGEVGR